MQRRDFIQKTGMLGLGMGLAPRDVLTSHYWTKDRFPLFIFSKHLQFLGYKEMAVKAKELGFDGVDLTVRPGGHVEPKSVVGQLPKAVEAITHTGLRQDMMTTAIKSVKEPHTERIIREAAKAGIKYYRMGYLRYDHNKNITENLLGFQKELKELADMNRHYGIKGAYQNHAGTAVGAAVWDLHFMLKDIDQDWLGIQYDVKHATAEGGYSWVNGFRLVNEMIHTLDLKDFLWKQKNDGTWRSAPVPLGEGMVNWSEYQKLLGAYDISAPICVHYEYELGGADRGKREISMPVDEIYEFMRRDVAFIKNWLAGE